MKTQHVESRQDFTENVIFTKDEENARQKLAIEQTQSALNNLARTVARYSLGEVASNFANKAVKYPTS